jgi:hypothetical protein
MACFNLVSPFVCRWNHFMGNPNHIVNSPVSVVFTVLYWDKIVCVHREMRTYTLGSQKKSTYRLRMSITSK